MKSTEVQTIGALCMCGTFKYGLQQLAESWTGASFTCKYHAEINTHPSL